MKEKIKRKIKDLIKRHKEAVEKFEKSGVETIAAIADAVIESINNGGTIYICGNGGSAADAQHIAAELVGRFEKDRPALPAVALTTDTSLLTSVANDYTYENIFARQVDALVEDCDILLAISTSGSSPNVIAAARGAKRKKAIVIAFTGGAKSPLEKIADLCLCTKDTSTARSQEIHQLAYHIICAIVEEKFSIKNG